MAMWKSTAVAAACLFWQTNAFLSQNTVKSSTSLFVMPDQPFQDSTDARPLQREATRPAEYRPEGRSYYPEGGVMPDQWTPSGPMETRRKSFGYGMEAREAFGNFEARGRGETIQGGGTRKTWQTSAFDQTTVEVGSEGRPIYTSAQVWEGPNNVPASMSLYSEDGRMQPWRASFQMKGSSSVMDIRNAGPLEFPVDVAVLGEQDGTRGMGKMEKEAVREYRPSPNKVTQDVQGGSLKYFNVPAGVAAVMVELFSEGRPMYANVELWQGPNNIKQCAEIYSDNGNDRVWNAVIETHGREGTIAVRNVGPALVYPFKASVDPIYYD